MSLIWLTQRVWVSNASCLCVRYHSHTHIVMHHVYVCDSIVMHLVWCYVSDITHIHTSCMRFHSHTYVMYESMCPISLTYIRDTQTCVTKHIHVCDMTHLHMWHSAVTCAPWPTDVCATLTHVHVSHGTFICVTSLTHMCVKCGPSHVRHRAFTCVTWLTYAWATWLTYVWHSKCVTWLIHICDVTQLHVWRGTFTFVMRLPYACAMWLTNVWHSNVWRDSFTCVTWHTYMCDVAHSHLRHYSLTRVFGMVRSHVWYRIRVRVRHESHEHKRDLQKRPIKETYESDPWESWIPPNTLIDTFKIKETWKRDL